MNAYEKRCEDCIECQKKNGVMVCSEKWDKPCSTIEDCPLEIDFEEVQEIVEKTKDYKVQHGAKAEDKKERKKPERKPDLTKEGAIEKIAESLRSMGYDSVEITNKSKIIEFKIGNEWYKLDLIRSRNRNKGIAPKK